MRVPGDEEDYVFDVRVVNDPRAAGVQGQVRYLMSPLDPESLHNILVELDIDLSMPVPPPFLLSKITHINNALAVPTSAINTETIHYPTGEGTPAQVVNYSYVFIYENGTVRRQNVITGVVYLSEDGFIVEILDGLYEGQEVVLR
jgi:hypothetical protein